MKKMLAIVLLFLSLVAQGGTCFPQNNRQNPVSVKSINTITQEQFSKVIEEAKAVYSPIFKEKYDAELVVEEKWDDATINAYATQNGNQWQVTMFGGLARDPLVTKDGFMGVICHEIGHHVGGAPIKGFGWAANEGQSDYFATAKCLKKIFEKDLENTVKIYRKSLDNAEHKLAKKACEDVYKSEQEIAICFRSALAGESLAKLLGSLGGNADVRFSTPDPAVVKKTDHNHPKGQCRMDTFFQGSLCDKDHNIFPSRKDVSEGYCTSKESYKVGIRPLCWYAPSQYE